MRCRREAGRLPLIRAGLKRGLLAGLAALFMCGCLARTSAENIAEESAGSDGPTSVFLADGTYYASVTLSGGSGRAAIESPAELKAENGSLSAKIVFSSPYYDYMIVEGEKLLPVNTEGNSAFRIPVAGFDRDIEVVADTTAMSVPHEISYTLRFDSSTIGTEYFEDESVKEAPSGNGGKTEEGSGEGAETGELSWNELSVTESLPLAYAECFSADHYGDDYTLLSVMDDERFLIAEEGAPVPSGLPDDITVLKKPFSRIYLASSSAMDFFLRLSAEDMISMTSTKAEDWSLPAAKELVEAGDILYVGKYNAPDYERLIERDCDLAIENTMIYHNPETKELIEKLEIPVLVERSSYEKHPLGRMEWIKVYGLLCGKEEEAGKFFSEATERLDQMLSAGDPAAGSAERPKTAFFYITAGGLYNIRRPGDYITKMIGLAGGEYVFDTIVSEAGNASSSMNVTAEEFYERAREADILIYNSTVEGELFALSDLLAKDPLLADYKAVREGNVWCTEKNMFQEITGTADMIGDLALLMNGRAEDDLRFIHRLK